MEGKFVTARDCAKYLGLDLHTFKSMVAKGELPQPITITGKRLKLWTSDDLSGMPYLISVRERLRKSTTDELEEDTET